MAIAKYTYEGEVIAFDFGDTSEMINATQMAKPFGKLVGGFLRLQGTKEYIAALQERYDQESLNNRTPHREVTRIIQGGEADLQGTWMDQKLALKFAMWLNVKFELWVTDKIEELLKTGKTEIDTRPGFGLIKSIRMIADQLESHEKDIQDLKEGMSEMQDYVGDIEARLTVQDKNFLSVAAYCSLEGVDCPLDKAQQWGYKCTVLSKKTNKHFYHIHDPRFGKVGVYHKEVLQKIIK